MPWEVFLGLKHSIGNVLFKKLIGPLVDMSTSWLIHWLINLGFLGYRAFIISHLFRNQINWSAFYVFLKVNSISLQYWLKWLRQRTNSASVGFGTQLAAGKECFPSPLSCLFLQKVIFVNGWKDRPKYPSQPGRNQGWSSVGQSLVTGQDPKDQEKDLHADQSGLWGVVDQPDTVHKESGPKADRDMNLVSQGDCPEQVDSGNCSSRIYKWGF